MSRTWKTVLVILAILIGAPFAGYFYLKNLDDPFLVVFNDNCVVCHGEDLKGTPRSSSAPRRYSSRGKLESDSIR